ncbi:ParB/RepB/Spo0J family partition protein [Thermodesulfatator atlanticus]
MSSEFSLIELTQIDFEDRTFCVSYPERAELLRESIDLVGIIHPPVLRPKSTAFQIISGRGRLIAAKTLGIKKTFCRILPGWTDDLTCLSLCCEENITSRGLNLVEKAQAVEKFRGYLSDKEVIEKVLPRLGFPAHHYHLELLEKIAFLEEEGKKLLVEERLNPKAVLKLFSFDEKGRRKILAIFREIPFSSSRQRIFLEMLEDLSRKEKKSVVEILEDRTFQALLADQDLSPQQKTEALFAFLHKLLNPRIWEREERFKKLAARLREVGVKISPSPGFEKDEYSLTFNFKNPDELEQKWEKIKTILNEFT